MQSNQNSASSIIEHKISLTKDEQELAKLAPFFKRLEKDNFTIEKFDTSERKNKISFHNCKAKQRYIFDGTGIEHFYFKRKNPTSDYVYPDFNLTILTFASIEEAKEYEEKIRASFIYIREIEECDWFKAPEKVVSNGRFIFYLTTRAEMLRTYTERYGEILKNLALSKDY